MDIIENLARWREQYRRWQSKQKSSDSLAGYPFIENSTAPFTAAHRALSMMNLALISSAGAYIDGTDAFDTSAVAGDRTFRESPTDIRAVDWRLSARGHDQTGAERD